MASEKITKFVEISTKKCLKTFDMGGGTVL